MRDQLGGIRNAEDAKQLRERLELLPEGIQELYSHILQRIDKFYWKEVAQYLHLMLYDRNFSLFDIALAVHKRIDDIILFSPAISFHDICDHCEYTKERISTTCIGLLEVQGDRHEWRKEVTEPSKIRYSGTVG